MPIFRRWYGGKKPTLQIGILRSIAIEGELSKRKLQDSLNAHYPDISDATELLKKRKIIEWSRDDHKSRRAEHYYKLTRRGLEVIIDEFPDLEIFWKGIINYCYLSKNSISSEDFDVYYKAFEAKYVGYSQTLDFFFQFDFVDKLLERWIKSNKEPINIVQKVLECIAIHRCITLEQIINYLQMQKTKYEYGILEEHRNRVGNKNAQFSDLITESQRIRYNENDILRENIISVIDGHTLSSDSFDQFSELSERSEINAQYSDFINHLLIHVIENKAGNRYELTLFGIILILAIIHYNHRYQSKIYFNEFLDKPRDKNYYNIIVSNYKDKLPLIFAKWQLLTEVFNGVDQLMANFEPIFYKEIRAPLISRPMNIGGVKEIYENTLGIAYYRYSKLAEIHESGVTSLEDISETRVGELSLVNNKLSDIELLLLSADLKDFMEYVTKQSYDYISNTSIVASIENSFANEISLLFYIVLTRQGNFLPEYRDEHIMPSRLFEFMERGNQRRNFVKPRKILCWILQQDNEIKRRFLTWYKDSILYEKQIMDSMINLQSEVDLP